MTYQRLEEGRGQQHQHIVYVVNVNCVALGSSQQWCPTTPARLAPLKEDTSDVGCPASSSCEGYVQRQLSPTVSSAMRQYPHNHVDGRNLLLHRPRSSQQLGSRSVSPEMSTPQNDCRSRRRYRTRAVCRDDSAGLNSKIANEEKARHSRDSCVLT